MNLEECSEYEPVALAAEASSEAPRLDAEVLLEPREDRISVDVASAHEPVMVGVWDDAHLAGASYVGGDRSDLLGGRTLIVSTGEEEHWDAGRDFANRF